MANFLNMRTLLTAMIMMMMMIIRGHKRDDNGDGDENVTRAASNLIALIPSRSVRQMLAICSGV